MLAALSLWLAAFAITVPYTWFLGRGVGIVRDALVTGVVVGTLLAVFLASLGLIVSLFARSNRVSLSLSLFLLLALFAPTQLPSNAQKGWAGELLLRVNPLTAGEHYVGKILVNGHAWSEDLSWLLSPLGGSPWCWRWRRRFWVRASCNCEAVSSNEPRPHSRVVSRRALGHVWLSRPARRPPPSARVSVSVSRDQDLDRSRSQVHVPINGREPRAGFLLPGSSPT